MSQERPASHRAFKPSRGASGLKVEDAEKRALAARSHPLWQGEGIEAGTQARAAAPGQGGPSLDES